MVALRGENSLHSIPTSELLQDGASIAALAPPVELHCAGTAHDLVDKKVGKGGSCGFFISGGESNVTYSIVL